MQPAWDVKKSCLKMKVMIVFAANVKLKKSRFIQKEKLNSIWLKKYMEIFGYNVKDVSHLYIKKFCVHLETAQYSTEE